MADARIYRFELFGLRDESRGKAEFKADIDALGFAESMVRDLLEGSGLDYAGCHLLIAEGTRTVAILPMVVPN